MLSPGDFGCRTKLWPCQQLTLTLWGDVSSADGLLTRDVLPLLAFTGWNAEGTPVGSPHLPGLEADAGEWSLAVPAPGTWTATLQHRRGTAWAQSVFAHPELSPQPAGLCKTHYLFKETMLLFKMHQGIGGKESNLIWWVFHGVFLS